MAVIVNDLADVNMDGAEVAGSAEFRTSEPRLVELSGGCVCCTLRADLIDVRLPQRVPAPRPDNCARWSNHETPPWRNFAGNWE